jgi:hypothetical protein
MMAAGEAGGRTGMGVGRARSRGRGDKVRQKEYRRWTKL